MEPLLPEDRQDIENLATDLVAKASTLAGRLHPVMRASVGDLVRSMNCYYSNLIDGHNTLPIDIDQAANNDLAKRAGAPQSAIGSARSHRSPADN